MSDAVETNLVAGAYSLEEAIQALEVAAALGFNIPSIPGATVHFATIHFCSVPKPNGESIYTTHSLGVYATAEAAKTAVRNWIIKDEFRAISNEILVANPQAYPLTVDLLKSYTGQSDDEVIASFFPRRGLHSLAVWRPRP